MLSRSLLTTQALCGPCPCRESTCAPDSLLRTGTCSVSAYNTTSLHGVLTLASYAALHLDDQGAQVAALITLSAAVWHWGSEWLVFGSTDWTRARFGLVLDAGSAAWIAWRLL